ncbi:hypothetical protein MIMGU_mgv1a013497mg [Erythranthe guttata]|uniref:Uncharacterized protein n=1 Tax=Erythranthe guttata TaxID=4155 RepID=A0A022S2W7_ERYGU|nr:hypothetical protein MIMGU_mgv1a013497mg [Erythranthe guttata]
MPMEEGGGSSETEFVNIDTASYSLDSSAIFHVVTDIIAFILFMHQQIPSVLQDITQEFDELRAEFKELEVELAKNEVKAISTRRKQATRKREGSVVSGDFSRSKTADNLSRKAIRTMISSGAGADSYAGPTKLFLLVKAPSHLNLPLHFLPKREFRQNRKRVPLRLRFRCRTRDPQMNAQLNDCANSDGLIDSASNDLIWFQCRHTIKGIAFRTSPPED